MRTTVEGSEEQRGLRLQSARVSRQRGQFVESPWAPLVTGTVHPSSVLRASDEHARAEAFDGLVTDLTLVRRELSA